MLFYTFQNSQVFTDMATDVIQTYTRLVWNVSIDNPQ